MTTPAERTEAVKIASSVAKRWAQGLPLADSTSIAEWRYMLRHLPTLGELELTHEKCPELWGKP